MKIAVFIKSTTLHRNHGGLETQNDALCKGLTEKGDKITIFSPKKELSFDSTEKDGVKYIFIDADYKNYIFAGFRKNSWYKKSLEVFSKIHEKEKFDIVLGQSASAESIIENKNKLGVKVVSIAHGTTSSEYITFLKNVTNLKDVYWLIRNTQYFFRQYFGRQRRYVLHSDRVVAVSNYVKKSLISETFVLDDKVDVIHNGVDGKLFENVPEKRNMGGMVHLYFLGRVEKSKGILTILEIIKNINKDIIFHVVGDGPCVEKAKDTVRSYGIQEKVVFHGRVSPHSEFIKKANPDIFVFPTQRIEGFPMVLVEAMFAGIPTVAFDCGGVSDAVENEKTGYLIKAGDKKGFEEKLVKLIDEDNVRLEFGRNSKEKAEKEFTLDRMIESYEKVFSEVLE